MGRQPLSKGELEVARVIWRLGEATVGQVHEACSANRPIDYSTVQTYIRRVEAKGYLSARRLGRTKIYSPKVRPGLVIREAVDEFLNQLFDGEMVPLMRHLIDDREMSDDELKQLRQLLKEKDPDDASPSD